MKFKVLIPPDELKALQGGFRRTLARSSTQVAEEYARRGVTFLRRAEGRAGVRRRKLAMGWYTTTPKASGDRVEVEIRNRMEEQSSIPVRSNAPGRRVVGRISGAALMSILIYGAARHTILPRSARRLIWNRSTEGQIFGSGAYVEKGFGRMVSKRDASNAGTYAVAMSVRHPGVQGSHSIPWAVRILQSIPADEVWRQIKVASF
jgi:hypothetical protein